MENDITPVQEKKQEEFAHVKLIRETMNALEWIPAELSRQSGVDQVSIHRLFEEGKDIYGSKVYNLLEALSLISKNQPHQQSATEIEEWKDKYFALLEKMDKLRDELDRYKEKEKWDGKERRIYQVHPPEDGGEAG